MIIDQTIERTLARKLREQNNLDRKNHISSGKLSASRLYWPLQWQILNALGVPSSESDDYSIRKFKRGDHVEEFVVSQMDGVILPGHIREQEVTDSGAKWNEQKGQWEVFYRDVIGNIDAIVDSSDYEYKNGIIPHEIKSVVNSKFKWIEKRLSPDIGHALQSTLYALAIGTEVSIIDYVASDDYRVSSFVIPVSDYRGMVEQSIEEYDAALERWRTARVLPDLVAREEWQLNPKWASYPWTVGLTTEQIIEKAGLL